MNQVKAGDPITAKGWNDLAQEVENPRHNGTAGIAIESRGSDGAINVGNVYRPLRKWVGMIVTAGPASEPDYTDNRYWVQLSAIGNSGDPTNLTNNRNLVLWAPRTDTYEGWNIVTATNMAERQDYNDLFGGPNHFLQPGRTVIVWEELDNGAPATVRFYFSMMEDEIVFELLDYDGGDAQYTAYPFYGLSTAISGTAFTASPTVPLPGFTNGGIGVGGYWLACNLDELSLKGHRLAVTSIGSGYTGKNYMVGKVVGPKIIHFHGGIGRVDSPISLTTVGQGWKRDNGPSDTPPGGVPVSLSGTHTYDLVFDARGMLYQATCVT